MTNATEAADVWTSVKDACRRSIRQTEKTTPNKKSAAAYEPFYRTFDKLYFDLKDRFNEMANLSR